MTFDNETYIVDEDAGKVQLLLFLSNPSSFTETVQVFIEDITAIGKLKLLFDKIILHTLVLYTYIFVMYCDDTGGGIDYDAEEYDVTFAIGLVNASLDISINNDSLLEKDETFRVSIHSVTNNHSVGIPGELIVTILDSTSKHFLYCCVDTQVCTYVCCYGTSQLQIQCHMRVTCGVLFPHAGVQVITCTYMYMHVHACGLYTHSVPSNRHACQCCIKHNNCKWLFYANTIAILQKVYANMGQKWHPI